jgi:hypothetical protein
MASDHDLEEISVQNLFVLKKWWRYYIKILPMGCYFGVLTIIRARVVGNCAIFAEMHESELDLIRFSNILCHVWRMG